MSIIKLDIHMNTTSNINLIKICDKILFLFEIWMAELYIILKKLHYFKLT